MRSHLALILAAFCSIAAPVSASDLRHIDDATLRALYFIDDKEGWIVGDEGLILHTLNGGKRWTRQPTGVRASLRSVQFINASIGWAAGREELPYGMGSVGILLFTNDGGLEWKKQLPDALPGLNQVRFVDPRNGYLLGDGNDQFPSGVFKTNDSGRTWQPIPGPRTTTWLTSDFHDDKNGILAGGWSRFAILRDGKITLADHSDVLSGRDITSLRILGKKSLAVAQGGLVLSSVKGGEEWGYAKPKLPIEVLANLDFHSLHVVKDKLWIVGRPGSVVLHSADAGATWSLLKTGQPFPLHAVFFFDEKLGWAVGDAGTILGTTDGGKSWTVNQGGTRVAVLCVHPLNKTAPVDTLAHLGGAEGFLTASLRITAPDLSAIAWGREQDARRYAAAVRLAGGMTGETLWHFPMPQYLERCDVKAILAHWNRLHNEGGAEEELIRQLVLALRMWRPSVVISDAGQDAAALSALLGEALTEAIRRAGDAKAFPEQLDEIGLAPWTVQKTWRVDRNMGPCTLKHANNEPNARLQGTIGDFAAAAHGLLVDRYQSLPKERTYQPPSSQATTKAVPAHLLEGIECKVGESRRNIKLNESIDEKLRQIVLQQRTTITIADNIDDPAEALKLVVGGLDKLADEHAASTAFAVAGRYAERGQWLLAQEIYLYLVDRCPAHPLSAEAYRWLIRFNTSREARRRQEMKDFKPLEPLGPTKRKDATILRVGNEEPAPESLPSLSGRGQTRQWNKGCFEFLKRLGGYGSVFSFHPQTQFCVQSAKRQLGDAKASHDWMTRYRNLVTSGPAYEAAQAEVWLIDRSQPAPRNVARARYTEPRPFLDGKFDDPCWKDWKPMVLDNAIGDTKGYATEAMFAFDNEFLYIALRCTHPAGQLVTPVKPRPRDADVDTFDRVSILLDLDRDYATAYHLEVDQRGCVRDSCWGDKSWNPRWFVALHSTDKCWQIEAAIPLGELASERIGQNTAWALNVARVLPGRGVQSWSQPADVEPRLEGMSLLMFELGQARPMTPP